ncbi:hypothetical protein B0H11DRAFT_2208535 [Mycena galericulata]|nr:hypothetical protein B0H11DRAFT_2208535 [Mycena galericulata]
MLKLSQIQGELRISSTAIRVPDTVRGFWRIFTPHFAYIPYLLLVSESETPTSSQAQSQRHHVPVEHHKPRPRCSPSASRRPGVECNSSMGPGVRSAECSFDICSPRVATPETEGGEPRDVGGKRGRECALLHGRRGQGGPRALGVRRADRGDPFAAGVGADADGGGEDPKGTVIDALTKRLLHHRARERLDEGGEVSSRSARVEEESARRRRGRGGGGGERRGGVQICGRDSK